MLIHCRLVGNLLYVNIKKYSDWQIDGPGMHQIAFEENFKPVSAFGHPRDNAGSIFDFRDQFFACCFLRHA